MKFRALFYDFGNSGRRWKFSSSGQHLRVDEMSSNLGLVENARFELLLFLSGFCCVGMCRGVVLFFDKLCDVGVESNIE